MESLRLAEHCDRVLNLRAAKLGAEYYYQSLPHCILDAVFSIGVRYASTQNVVTRYCLYSGMPKYRKDQDDLPPTTSQQSVKDFIAVVDRIGPTEFADRVLQNHQRTSTKNGILKAEAARQFANILLSAGANYFQDITGIRDSVELEASVRRIPGQTSGISLKYFFMLAGDDSLIKPDRMILRFLRTALNREPSAPEAQQLLKDSCELLREKYSHLTPRLLDYQIWNYQRIIA